MTEDIKQKDEIYGKPAGFWVRRVANVLDLTILWIALNTVMFALYFEANKISSFTDFLSILIFHAGVLLAIYSIPIIFLVWLYFYLMHKKCGQTLGMMIAGIKIVKDITGKQIIYIKKTPKLAIATAICIVSVFLCAIFFWLFTTAKHIKEISKPREEIVSEYLATRPDISEVLRESITEGKVILGMNPGEAAAAAGGRYFYEVTCSTDKQRPSPSKLILRFHNKTQYDSIESIPFAVYFASGIVYKIEDSSADNEANEHYYSGNDFSHKGKIDAAISEYKLAIEIKPEHADSHRALGWRYYKKGMVDDAVRECQLAIKYDSADGKAHYNLGLVYYFHKNMLDEAINEYKLAAKYLPKYSWAHFRMGQAYSDIGQVDKAIEEYKKAIALKHEDSGVYYNLGSIYHSRGFLDASIDMFKRSVKIDPKNANMHYMLGLAYYDKGLKKKAQKEYKRSIKYNPGYVGAHYGLGRVYYDRGEFDKAEKEFNLAVKCDPQYSGSYFLLGEIYLQQEEYEKALDAYSSSLKLDPGNDAIKERLKSVEAKTASK